MVSVSYHNTVNVLQGMSKKLSRPDSIAVTPFDKPEWLALIAASGCEPFIAVAANDQEAAALPMTRENGRLEPLANWYNFIWRTLGSADPAIMRELAQALKSQTHRVTLWPIPDEDGSASALEAAFHAAGWSVRKTACDHNHVLEVNGRCFADYWATRSGRMRTTLKRKAKKVEVAIYDHFDPAAWSAYEDIYRQSWKPEEGDPDMLRAFAEQEGSAGRIRLAIATHGNIPVAAQFWTVENGTAYIHKLAHLEEHKNLSAGTTLTAALFQRVIDDDAVSLVDFGTGNDGYKQDWMELDRPRYQLDCLDPKQLKAWPALLKRIIRP